MTPLDKRARRAWHLAILTVAVVGDEDPLRRRWLREAIAWQRHGHRQRPYRYVPVQVDRDDEGNRRAPYMLQGLSKAERRAHIRAAVRAA